MVRFFRGEISGSELNAPFAYRPLLPLIAAILPISPQIMISFLNLCFIVFLSWVYVYIAREFDISHSVAFLTSALYSLSWVVMYYGAVVLVDSGAILSISMAFLMMLRDQRNWKIGLVLLLGVLVKETVMIGLVAYLFLKRKFTLAVIMPAPIAYGLVRITTPVSNPGFFWNFHLRAFADLFSSRMKTFLVTLVPYLALIVVGMLIRRKNNLQSQEEQRYLLSTGLPALGFLGVGIFLAHFDARFVWPLYPALVPITAHSITSIMKFVKKRLGNLESE